MKWLTKPRFTWADFFFLFIMLQFTTYFSFWGFFFVAVVWFFFSEYMIDKNFHEPLPKD